MKLTEQTLRFVQSLPKRERQPLSLKFKNADPLGMTYHDLYLIY